MNSSWVFRFRRKLGISGPDEDFFEPHSRAMGWEKGKIWAWKINLQRILETQDEFNIWFLLLNIILWLSLHPCKSFYFWEHILTFSNWLNPEVSGALLSLLFVIFSFRSPEASGLCNLKMPSIKLKIANSRPYQIGRVHFNQKNQDESW